MSNIQNDALLEELYDSYLEAGYSIEDASSLAWEELYELPEELEDCHHHLLDKYAYNIYHEKKEEEE